MLVSLLLKKHLEEDEQLVRVVHKHWLLGLKGLFWPTVFFTGVVVVLALQPVRPLFLAASLLGVVIAVWWLRSFFDYYLDAWIITDQGIIDVAWHGWFHRESVRVLYSDVQGVGYEIQGVLGTLLRFGTISMEKISTGSAITLEYVSRPRTVVSTILNCQEQYLHSKNMKDGKQIQELLSSLVARHMQLDELQPEEDDE